jgi:hypothetical protein
LCCVLLLLCVSLPIFSRNQKGLQKGESRKVTQRKKQDKQIMFCLIRNYEQQFSIAHTQCAEQKRGNPETGMIQQFTRLSANSVTRIESVWTVLLYLKHFFLPYFCFAIGNRAKCLLNLYESKVWYMMEWYVNYEYGWNKFRVTINAFILGLTIKQMSWILKETTLYMVRIYSPTICYFSVNRSWRLGSTVYQSVNYFIQQ